MKIYLQDIIDWICSWVENVHCNIIKYMFIFLKNVTVGYFLVLNILQHQ